MMTGRPGRGGHFRPLGRSVSSLGTISVIRYGKTTQTAIAAMSRLAEAYGASEPLSSHDIARDRELAQPLVAKLLTMLSQAGLVNGSRGPGGGYSLAKKPREISLQDIAAVFERPDDKIVCPFGPNWCGNHNPCPLHDAYVEFVSEFEEYLSRTRLDVFCPAPAGEKRVRGRR